MAFSGSNDFGQTTQTIITDALILCGGLEDDETPSDEQRNYARRALNRMSKAWSVKGLKAWCWNEESLTLATSQKSYSIGPSGSDLTTERPIRITNIRKIVTGTEEVPIRQMSRQEYMEQPSKDSDSEPVAVFYDPQLTNGTLYVWPSPAGAYTLKFSSQQYIEDFDTNSDDPYFPAEWLEAIVYNLAVRLAPKYEMKGAELQQLQQQARQYLLDAEHADTEQGSFFMSPEFIDHG
jgi:hypothetical protein